MLTIKKVAISELEPTTGSIVDSFTGVTDEHTNAPSINAIKNRIATLMGNVTLTANTSENVADNKWQLTTFALNYPTGFNRDNCIVIGFGVCNPSALTPRNSYGDISGSNNQTTANLYDLSPKGVVLDADTIKVNMYNYNTSAKQVRYQITLLKISDAVG